MGYFKQLAIQMEDMKMNQNAGIDYGRGLTNIDHETGIRYGVINQREVLQAWADSSEPNYNCSTCEQANSDEGCQGEFDCNPISFTYGDDGYTCEQSADDPDIFVTKSPYYTYCKFCSPCAPGAGYLMHPFAMSKNMPVDDSLPMGGYAAHAIASGFPMVYCLGYDWFEDGKAPYPVFSVETGELVTG